MTSSPLSADQAATLARLEQKLPPLLSAIAGMVDLTGFFTLGKVFTAHITGNLVVVAALAVQGGSPDWAQVLSIPVFILAVTATWLVARASVRRGPSLARLLLIIQFLLLAAVLTFSAIARPYANPHGWMATLAAMTAVAAMACQFAMFRIALPGATSTAVMTGNLTSAVLSFMDTMSPTAPLMAVDATRLKRSLSLLLGFFAGCVVASAAILLFDDWAWALPVALAALAVALC